MEEWKGASCSKFGQTKMHVEPKSKGYFFSKGKLFDGTQLIRGGYGVVRFQRKDSLPNS